MTTMEAIAENYNISDREFILKLTGAEVLALISLIQLGKAATAPIKFVQHFGETISIAEGLIEVVSEVDGEAGDQLRKGWRL